MPGVDKLDGEGDKKSEVIEDKQEWG